MKKLSCLLVDDNPVATRELTDNLKYIGHKDIHNSTNGNDAWSMLQIKKFDCIVSAWEMPDMSGLALLKIVRRDDRFFNIPFFLSSDAFTKVKVIQAGVAGVTGLITKPYALDTIKRKMEVLSETAEERPPFAEEIKFELPKRFTQAIAKTLTGPSFGSTNLKNPDTVGIQPLEVQGKTGKFTALLPPCSLTAIRLSTD